MRSCAHKVSTVSTLSQNLRSENDKVHKVEKVTKINSRFISKPHAHLQTMEKTCAKFQKDWYKIVWEVALTRYPLSQHFHRIWRQKMTKFAKWKKWQKLKQGLYPNQMHMFRPWRKYVQSFKKIVIKIVWGVALTRYLLSIHWGRKRISSQSGKSDKKLYNNYIQTTCTSSYHDENTCNVSKKLVQNCKRSCAHKTPRVNVDGRTDEWTDGQIDGNLHA